MDIRTLPDIHDKAILPKCRSSCPEVFCKKGVLRNFGKFTGKHLCLSLLLIKLQASGLQLYKEETLAQVFFCEFCEISTPFFTEHLPWLLLKINKIWKLLIKFAKKPSHKCYKMVIKLVQNPIMGANHDNDFEKWIIDVSVHVKQGQIFDIIIWTLRFCLGILFLYIFLKRDW